MSTSPRTDTDRRAYLMTRLRKAVDAMMDDDGSDTSPAADANRAMVMRTASYYAELVAAFPPPATGDRKLTPPAPRKTTPPRK